MVSCSLGLPSACAKGTNNCEVTGLCALWRALRNENLEVLVEVLNSSSEWPAGGW